jgi:thiamine kinase-like enzyme
MGILAIAGLLVGGVYGFLAARTIYCVSDRDGLPPNATCYQVLGIYLSASTYYTAAGALVGAAVGALLEVFVVTPVLLWRGQDPATRMHPLEHPVIWFALQVAELAIMVPALLFLVPTQGVAGGGSHRGDDDRPPGRRGRELRAPSRIHPSLTGNPKRSPDPNSGASVRPAMATDAPTDAALVAAIQAIPGWNDRALQVLPIEEGRTNKNFRVTADGEPFFLRLAGKDTELLGIDRDAEQASMRAAAAAGIGPEVFAYLPELGCLVTRWVDADPLGEGDLERPEVLGPVVDAIKAIHAGPPLSWSFDPFRIVEDYRRISEERGVAIPDAFDHAHDMAVWIEEAFRAIPMPLVPCHNDLLESNFILRDGHVWVVDHEYAGMGDPFFDLGNLSINNALSDDAQERLLALYFGTPTDAQRARLKLMRIMSDFREAMWGIVQQGLSTLDIDYVEYAQKHFDRLSSTMADPHFDDWVDTARGT